MYKSVQARGYRAGMGLRLINGALMSYYQKYEVEASKTLFYTPTLGGEWGGSLPE